MIQDMTNAILSISSTFTKLIDDGFIDANGFWTKSSDTSITFEGSLQPLTSEDLKHMKVGLIAAGRSKLYVPILETELNVKDRVQDQNLTIWVITDVIDYSLDGGYKKYFAEREVIV
ncbi:MAG: hypothetical protein KAJ19_18025 [Gammaproteobacteria bacterium]|nr:hypothetical protein [Gammaproteobacteria bacterium]